MTRRDIEVILNLYGWGRWALVDLNALMGPQSILGKLSKPGYRETKHQAPFISDEEAMEIDRAIASLDPAEHGNDVQTVLLRHYGCHMSYRDNAEQAGRSKDKIADMITTAVGEIYQHLAEDLD